MRSAACSDGTDEGHTVCRCEQPGQDTRWAGLVVAWDERFDAFRPLAACDCQCHTQPVVG